MAVIVIMEKYGLQNDKNFKKSIVTIHWKQIK